MSLSCQNLDPQTTGVEACDPSFNAATLTAASLRWVVVAIIVLTCWFQAGCKPAVDTVASDDEVDVAPPDPMKVLVVGSEKLASELQRYWSAEQDGEITTQNQTEQAWVASGFEVEADTDLVVFPPMYLGELCERDRLQRIPLEKWNGEPGAGGDRDDRVDKGSLLKHYANRIVVYQRAAYGLPLGSPHFAMFYDATAFPKSEKLVYWSTLEKQLASQPAKSAWQSISSQGEQPKLDLPLGPGWAGSLFLSRVAPGVMSLGSFSPLFQTADMKPTITGQPFVEALDQLKRIASARSTQLTPQQVVNLVVEGKSLGGIGFAATDSSVSAKAGNAIKVIEVPGTEQGFDARTQAWKKRHELEPSRVDHFGFSGLMIGMARTSRYPNTAYEVMVWLAEKKKSAKLMPAINEVGPFRAGHLGDMARWTGRSLPAEAGVEYGDVIRNIHQRPLILTFPRVPGTHRYYQVLDEMIRECVAKQSDSLATLHAISDQWEAITQELGRQKQVKAMSHDLGF